MTDWGFDLKTIIVLVIPLVVAAVIAYLANWRRNRKSLAWEIVSQNPLVARHSSVDTNISIHYAGERVDNVHLVVLRLINDGNQPIEAAHFEKAVSFYFGDDARILSVENIFTDPGDLRPVVGLWENRAEINPCLLNRRDSMKLRFLVSAKELSIRPEGRIVGVKEIRRLGEGKKYRYRSLYRAGALLSGVGFAGAIGTELLVRYEVFVERPMTIVLVSLLLAISGFMCFSLGLTYTVIEDSVKSFRNPYSD